MFSNFYPNTFDNRTTSSSEYWKGIMTNERNDPVVPINLQNYSFSGYVVRNLPTSIIHLPIPALY